MSKKLIPVSVNDVEAEPNPISRGEMERFAEDMSKVYFSHVEFYKNTENLSLEEAHKMASEPLDDMKLALLRETPCKDIHWSDLNRILVRDNDEFLQFWEGIKRVVREQLQKGVIAADTMKCKTPFEKAIFSEVRKSFIEEWQPRGGIEMAMIDVLVQSHLGYMRWSSVAFAIEAYQYSMIEEKGEKGKGWHPPEQKQADLLEYSMNRADSFNRIFLRTLRQMRDLRRYSQPIVVKGAGQVNIATDGGKQVNMKQSKKKKSQTIARKGPKRPNKARCSVIKRDKVR